MDAASSAPERGSTNRHSKKQREIASWRTYARNRLSRLDDEVALAKEFSAELAGPLERGFSADVAGPREQPAAFFLIQARLEEVSDTLSQSGLLRGFRNWLTGIDIERVWFCLHEAEQLLYLVDRDDAIRAKISSLRAEVALRLPQKSDPQLALLFASQLQAIEGPVASPGKSGASPGVDA
jgi:hypothetical protein